MSLSPTQEYIVDDCIYSTFQANLDVIVYLPKSVTSNNLYFQEEIENIRYQCVSEIFSFDK